jgi:hypothetical protein
MKGHWEVRVSLDRCADAMEFRGPTNARVSLVVADA